MLPVGGSLLPHVGQLLPQGQVFVLQPGRFPRRHNRTLGGARDDEQAQPIDISFHIGRELSLRGEFKIALEMMQGANLVFQLILIKHAQPVMRLRRQHAAVQRGFKMLQSRLHLAPHHRLIALADTPAGLRNREQVAACQPGRDNHTG